MTQNPPSQQQPRLLRTLYTLFFHTITTTACTLIPTTHAQDTIAFQSFEGAPTDNWLYTETPDSLISPVQSWACHGQASLALRGTPTGNVNPQVAFQPITLNPNGKYLFSISYGARGPDSQEDLFLIYSTDMGTTWDTIKLVDGWSNIVIYCNEVDPNSTAGGGANQNPYQIALPPNATSFQFYILYDVRPNFSSHKDTFFIDYIFLIADTTKPHVERAIAYMPDTIRLYLSEPLDTTQWQASDFLLTDTSFSDTIYGTQLIWTHPTQPLLVLNKPLSPQQPYYLFTDTLTDRLGNTALPETLIVYLPGWLDIIITEFFPDPTPPVGLPDCDKCEYVEIYNRTPYSISLEGWTLANRSGYTVRFPQTYLPPYTYALLIHEQGAPLFSSLAPFIIAFPTFPYVHNDWGKILLRTRWNTWSDIVVYDESFYHDPLKSQGGWAIERVTLQPVCGGKNLWHASQHPRGGTPGTPNSFQTESIHMPKPLLLKRRWQADTLTILEFSEPLPISALDTNHYVLLPDNRHPTSAFWWTNDPRKIALHWRPPLDSQTTYQIAFQIPTCPNLTILQGNTTIAKPCPPDSFAITFNEILFNPYPNGATFVELYNRSSCPINTADLLLANTICTSDTLDYIAPLDTAGELFFPGEYRVYTTDSSGVLHFYKVEHPEWLRQTRPLPYMTAPASCNYRRGLVLLQRTNYHTIDHMIYAETFHHPLVYENNYGEGVSLEKIHPDLSSRDSMAWMSASQEAGFATPTAPNSQYQPLETIQANQEIQIAITPPLISPDNDGIDDYALIQIHTRKRGWILSARIFSADGYLVYTLAEGILTDQTTTLTWDGRTSTGRIAPTGHYVLVVEGIHPDGLMLRQKALIAIAYPMR